MLPKYEISTAKEVWWHRSFGKYLHLGSPLRGELAVENDDVALVCSGTRLAVSVSLEELLVNLLLGVDVLSSLLQQTQTFYF